MASVSSGIRRKVDDLGRVVIPAGIRRNLNIREGDAVEVSVDGERIVLSKPRDACVFCGREGDDLHRFRSRLVCHECVASIGAVGAEQRNAAAQQRDAAAQQPTGPFRPAPRPVPPTAGRPLPEEQGPRRDTAPRPAASDDGPGVAWPTGPIDGDALAREEAFRSASSARRLSDSERNVSTDDEGQRPPPYDPASTTAW